MLLHNGAKRHSLHTVELLQRPGKALWKLCRPIPPLFTAFLASRPCKGSNIPNTPTQHGYKTQHYTVIALHTLNNTVAKGLNQMTPIPVALDMGKSFDTINVHTLIIKLLQIRIPGTINKLSQSTSRDEKATQHTETIHPYNVNLKQGGVVSPIVFNIYTVDIPLRRWHHHHIYTHKHKCSQERNKTIPT